MTPHTISLTKPGGKRWIFRFAIDQEDRLLEALADIAADQTRDFDWRDAGYVACLFGQVERAALNVVVDKLEKEIHAQHSS